MKPALYIFFVLILLAALPAWGKRDPLNGAEVDQLRDVAQQPDKRLVLYAKFIQTRAESLQQLHSDPRFAADRDIHIHDLLEDIDTLVQELDDNIDVYERQNMDLRKPLKAVIAMDTDLQQRLRTMKQNSTPEALKNFGFALDSAIDSVGASLDNARQVAQDQEEASKNKKK
jgi:hypothetical protein